MAAQKIGNGHLAGRVVVVTGAGGGFGKLIAETAAARGAEVVLGDIDASAAEAAAKAIAFMSGPVEGPGGDIDSPAYWAIEPAAVAGEVVHAIDQPWGVTIGDVTIRATGEDFVI